MAAPALDAALAVLDPPPGTAPAPLVLGLSGGLDSTVLLHALVRRRGPAAIRALHVHHGLHPEADAWSEHCRRLCEELGVRLAITRVQVDTDSPSGPEGAAREARYAAFGVALEPGESLVLAHHRDDQAETVLLRLLRASGAGGLASIREQRVIAGKPLLRPLLSVPRASLLDYAHANALNWCEDPSNAEPAADRNFLRLQVLPLLRERWPLADAALAGSAARLAEDAQLLEEESRHRLEALGGGEDWLPVTALLALSAAWRAQVLRSWTRELGLPPLPGSAPAHITADVLLAPRDRAAAYRWQDARLLRWGDRLYGFADASPVSGEWTLPWDGRDPLALPDGGLLTLAHADGAGLEPSFGACHVHPRQGGERIVLAGRGHSHALKDRLRESGLPPWQRARLPLLRDGRGELLAAGDVVLSARLQDWCARHGARLHWRPAGSD